MLPLPSPLLSPAVSSSFNTSSQKIQSLVCTVEATDLISLGEKGAQHPSPLLPACVPSCRPPLPILWTLHPPNPHLAIIGTIGSSAHPHGGQISSWWPDTLSTRAQPQRGWEKATKKTLEFKNPKFFPSPFHPLFFPQLCHHHGSSGSRKPLRTTQHEGHHPPRARARPRKKENPCPLIFPFFLGGVCMGFARCNPSTGRECLAKKHVIQALIMN